jgi:hypothetical protein
MSKHVADIMEWGKIYNKFLFESLIKMVHLEDQIVGGGIKLELRTRPWKCKLIDLTDVLVQWQVFVMTGFHRNR